MEVFVRGVRNVWRNITRSAAVILILTVVIAFGLVMLISLKAVEKKVADVRQSIGRTITVSPAGGRGFEGGGEPITTANITTVKGLAHVESITSTLTDRAQTDTDTTLQSAIDPGTLGRRNTQRNGRIGGTQQRAEPDLTNIKLPLMVTGTNTPSNTQAQGVSTVSLTSGVFFADDSADTVAVLGKALAEKNNLAVNGTFTLYGQTFTVVGIEDAGTEFANNAILVPLTTLQKLSDQADTVTTAYVTVDSLENLSSVQTAITTALGTKVDITSQIDEANRALKPLENIQTIALDSLIGALVAGTVIILLTMLMIVRERRKEVGVLKAIGASNFLISTQFMIESLTMSLVGALIGTVVGVLASSPVLNNLLSSASTTATSASATGLQGGPGGFLTRFSGQVPSAFSNLTDIHTTIGLSVLGYGLLIALGISLVGTLIPTLLIARIRPADVLRGE